MILPIPAAMIKPPARYCLAKSINIPPKISIAADPYASI